MRSFWKRFRWRSLVRVWAVFMAMAMVLFAESMGLHYGATTIKLHYLDRNKAIPERNAMADVKPRNLMLIDSSQEGVSEAVDMFDRIFLDMKVGTTVVDVVKTPASALPSFSQYDTVVVAMPALDPLGGALSRLMTWVKRGGNVMFAMTPSKTGYFDAISQSIGVDATSGDCKMTKSIIPESDFMLGGGEAYKITDPFESSMAVSLSDKATVEAVSGSGHVPLIWRAATGKGTSVVCNIGIYGKVMRGFYASAYSLLGSAAAYPVINGAAFYLDDFPSPVPSGNGKYIKRDYNMSIAEFYSRVWWPDLTKLAERYGIRFTGVMIENYGDDTRDAPVRQSDDSQFVYFGGLLLKQNGEIGYHGYNHQPLVLPNTDYGNEYDYVQWPSRKAMADSLKELIAFQKEMLPAANGSVYVPPSNVMSSEGRAVIGRSVPQIRTVASTYLPDGSHLPYVQEFGVASDGVVEEPRIVSGSMVGDSYMHMAAVSELNMHFVSTHFMHPDDLLDPDRGAAEGWAVYRDGFERYLRWLEKSAPSIRMQTGSGTAAAIQRYSGLTVDLKTHQRDWTLDLGNFTDEAWLMFRANNGVPGAVDGGSITHLVGNLYLLKATSGTVRIERKQGHAATAQAAARNSGTAIVGHARKERS